MALDAARDRARAGERLAGVSLSPRERILRRADGGGRHLLDVLLLVRRVPLPHGGPAQSAVLLREDARVRQSSGVVRQNTPAPRAAPTEIRPAPQTARDQQRPRRSPPAAVGGR